MAETNGSRESDQVIQEGDNEVANDLTNNQQGANDANHPENLARVTISMRRRLVPAVCLDTVNFTQPLAMDMLIHLRYFWQKIPIAVM